MTIVSMAQKEIAANTSETVMLGFNVPSDYSNYYIMVTVLDGIDTMNVLADSVIFD